MGRRTGEDDIKAVGGDCALSTGAYFVSDENGGRRITFRKRLWKWIRAMASEMKNQLLLDE